MDRGVTSSVLVTLLAACGAISVAASVPRSSPSHAEGPPPGFTGGFGEETCRSCHNEFELGLGGKLVVEGFPDRYGPGERYAVTLVLTSDGMTLAGFQAAIRGEAGRPMGRMVPLDRSVVVHPDTAGLGTPYLQHAPGGMRTDATASWSFEWTAPEDAVGPAILHASANGANGDDSPLGDVVYVTEARSVPSGR